MYNDDLRFCRHARYLIPKRVDFVSILHAYGGNDRLSNMANGRLERVKIEELSLA